MPGLDGQGTLTRLLSAAMTTGTKGEIAAFCSFGDRRQVHQAEWQPLSGPKSYCRDSRGGKRDRDWPPPAPVPLLNQKYFYCHCRAEPLSLTPAAMAPYHSPARVLEMRGEKRRKEHMQRGVRDREQERDPYIVTSTTIQPRHPLLLQFRLPH